MDEPKLRNCPFCHGKAIQMPTRFEYVPKLNQWAFYHFCKPRGERSVFTVSFYADTKEEIIEQWNGIAKE